MSLFRCNGCEWLGDDSIIDIPDDCPTCKTPLSHNDTTAKQVNACAKYDDCLSCTKQPGGKCDADGCWERHEHVKARTLKAMESENITSAPWPESRREELLSLIFMLSKLGTINQGSGFLDKAQECINVAKDLASGSVRDSRLSFVNFLTDEAEGEQPHDNAFGWVKWATEKCREHRREVIRCIAEGYKHDELINGSKCVVLMDMLEAAGHTITLDDEGGEP